MNRTFALPKPPFRRRSATATAVTVAPPLTAPPAAGPRAAADWAAADWAAVDWAAAGWGAAGWGAAGWAAVDWACGRLGCGHWAAVDWAAVDWAAVDWRAVDWRAGWAAVNWAAVTCGPPTGRLIGYAASRSRLLLRPPGHPLGRRLRFRRVRPCRSRSSCTASTSRRRARGGRPCSTRHGRRTALGTCVTVKLPGRI